MAKEVKIIWLCPRGHTPSYLSRQDKKNGGKMLDRIEAEAELSRLVNDNWVIVAAGGGMGTWGGGFVVLQRDT